MKIDETPNLTDFNQSSDANENQSIDGRLSDIDNISTEKPEEVLKVRNFAKIVHCQNEPEIFETSNKLDVGENKHLALTSKIKVNPPMKNPERVTAMRCSPLPNKIVITPSVDNEKAEERVNEWKAKTKLS